VLISAGGLTRDGAEFKPIKAKFLLHVKALAKRFKNRMLKALRNLRSKGKIQMTDGAFGTLMASLPDADQPLSARVCGLSKAPPSGLVERPKGGKPAQGAGQA
jgi:hypothetical protein